jgi:hypothetical protein
MKVEDRKLQLLHDQAQPQYGALLALRAIA